MATTAKKPIKNNNAKVRKSLEARDIARARCLRAARAFSLAAVRVEEGAAGAGRTAGITGSGSALGFRRDEDGPGEAGAGGIAGRVTCDCDG